MSKNADNTRPARGRTLCGLWFLLFTAAAAAVVFACKPVAPKDGALPATIAVPIGDTGEAGKKESRKRGPTEAEKAAAAALAEADEKTGTPGKEASPTESSSPAVSSVTPDSVEKGLRNGASIEELRTAFRQAGDLAEADTTAEAALLHARAALALSQADTDIDRQAATAAQALASLDAAGLSGDSLSAESAYYRASLRGLVLQAKGLGAAGKLPEIVALFERSEGRPGTDGGGPWRALGMLYLKAPAWPAGIGDIGLSLEYLEKAAGQFGAHPHNHICLARARFEDGNREGAATALSRAESLLASANWGARGAAWRREIAELRGAGG